MLEFKDTGTALEPQQARMIREINKRRAGAAYVVRAPGTVEDADGVVLGSFTSALGLLKILCQLTTDRA